MSDDIKSRIRRLEEAGYFGNAVSKIGQRLRNATDNVLANHFGDDEAQGRFDVGTRVVGLQKEYGRFLGRLPKNQREYTPETLAAFFRSIGIDIDAEACVNAANGAPLKDRSEPNKPEPVDPDESGAAANAANADPEPAVKMHLDKALRKIEEQMSNDNPDSVKVNELITKLHEFAEEKGEGTPEHTYVKKIFFLVINRHADKIKAFDWGAKWIESMAEYVKECVYTPGRILTEDQISLGSKLTPAQVQKTIKAVVQAAFARGWRPSGNSSSGAGNTAAADDAGDDTDDSQPSGGRKLTNKQKAKLDPDYHETGPDIEIIQVNRRAMAADIARTTMRSEIATVADLEKFEEKMADAKDINKLARELEAQYNRPQLSILLAAYVKWFARGDQT